MAVEANPLLSAKPSDSNLNVALHPLVLLTVSDQITRHRLRDLKGPVVGALLGQQKGREITAEQAFPCSVIENTNGEWTLDQEWMERRIQQYKDVHKAPALEFVGLFTLCPESGPGPDHVPLQRQAVTLYTETSILVAVHPEAVVSADAASANARLPLTVYESVDSEQVKDEGSMEVDGNEAQTIKFRSLPFSIETSETEMIAIDYVAKGAGTAIAVVDQEEREPSPATEERAEKKGKKRADLPEAEPQTNGVKDSTTVLSSEEEDQIAGITTRLNSVRMLQSRLTMVSTFLQSLPPSYLSDPGAPVSETSPDPAHLSHLRNIQALLTRLTLLTPAANQASTEATAATLDHLSHASLSQSNDVALSSLLSLVSQDIQILSEMGRKFVTVEHSKSQKSKKQGGAYQNAFGGIEEHDGRVGGGFGTSNVLM